MKLKFTDGEIFNSRLDGCLIPIKVTTYLEYSHLFELTGPNQKAILNKEENRSKWILSGVRGDKYSLYAAPPRDEKETIACLQYSESVSTGSFIDLSDEFNITGAL